MASDAITDVELQAVHSSGIFDDSQRIDPFANITVSILLKMVRKTAAMRLHVTLPAESLFCDAGRGHRYRVRIGPRRGAW